jgi:hypothetical protein
MPASVRAQARSTDPETLIRKGNDLRQQGRNEEALPLFQAAYAAARNPRTAGQLGLSEMTVGYWVEAETHLAEALEFPNHPWVAKNSEGLREMLKKARSKIAEVDVAGSPAGAEVRVNGRVVGALPLAKPLRIGEGRIQIEVVAPNHKSETRSLSVKGGEKETVTVNLEKVAPIAAVAARQPATSPPVTVPAPVLITPVSRDLPAERRSKWPAFATAGVSVLAVGFGTVELFRWQHAEDSFNGHLGPGPGSPMASKHDCGEQDPMRGGPGCQSLYDEAVQARTLSIVGFAVGGALAATSAVLWLSEPGAARERRVSCAVDPQRRRMECGWRF